MILINTDSPVETFTEAFRSISKPGLVVRGLKKDHSITLAGKYTNRLTLTVNHIEPDSILVRFKNVPQNISIYDTENKLVRQGNIVLKKHPQNGQVNRLKKGSFIIPESPKENGKNETVNLSIVLGDGKGTELKVFLDAANAWDKFCSIGVIGNVTFKKKTEKAVTLEVT